MGWERAGCSSLYGEYSTLHKKKLSFWHEIFVVTIIFACGGELSEKMLVHLLKYHANKAKDKAPNDYLKWSW
jgi:hypothetical protein